MSFTTKQLAGYVNGKLNGRTDVVCCGAEIDTRQPLDGKVFFALKGDHADGHNYVEQAALHGCSAIVVERDCDVTVPYVIVDDARLALTQLAKARRLEMAPDAVIAVTGSVGKTTTKDILACLLGQQAVASKNSFNNDLGVPLTILEGENAKYLVIEIGANDVGEIEPLARLAQPDIAILTSIERAHLAGFGDCATVLQEKSKLLESVHEHGFVIIADTIDISEMSIEATIIRVGQSDSADVHVRTGIDEFGFGKLEIDGKSVTLSMFGEHNAKNAALAVVAAKYATRSDSAATLLNLSCNARTPEGRLCKIKVGDITFLDDSYNANPASMRSALKLFTTLRATRKVLVLGDMLELGDSSHAEHRLLATVIENVGADLIFLVGVEMEAAIGGTGAIYLQDAASVDSIVSLLKSDDLILLKGSRSLQLDRIIDLVRQTKVLEH